MPASCQRIVGPGLRRPRRLRSSASPVALVASLSLSACTSDCLVEPRLDRVALGLDTPAVWVSAREGHFGACGADLERVTLTLTEEGVTESERVAEPPDRPEPPELPATFTIAFRGGEFACGSCEVEFASEEVTTHTARVEADATGRRVVLLAGDGSELAWTEI